MERHEAVKLLREALYRIEQPARNANGGNEQVGGAYWRLAKVIEQYLFPRLAENEGAAHAKFIINNHGMICRNLPELNEGEIYAGILLNESGATHIHLPEALIELAEDEHYAGIITSKDGDASYHLILLPGNAEDINFADATAWAKGQGGGLPTRCEQSLLFANCKDQFAARSYWSSEEHSAGGAWCQVFGSGYQSLNPKYDELRARAVRRLPI